MPATPVPIPPSASSPAASEAARAELLAALPSFVYRSEAFAEDLSLPVTPAALPVSVPRTRFGWPTRRRA